MNASDAAGFSALVMAASAAVVEHLNEHDRASAAELADIAGVSVQTIHRSARFLRLLGAPLDFEPLAEQGWSLEDKTWRLPLFELTRAGFVPARTE